MSVLRRRDRNEMLAFSATFEDGNLKMYGHSATVQDAAHRVVCCRFGRRDDEAGAQVALGLRAEAIRLRDKAIEDINKRYEEDEASRDSTFNGYDVLSDDYNEAP
ncbi:unnamed protein product [Clonostachys chloroleuca]|uniref:Uncharacterized protein n=1 Tax=Clonostachys chloroleuca TaxID=1926264 RepID=A0AA35QG44_9HYPO|nr:unnamed protein product [Clonostachys chloroleuca]